MEAIVSEYTIRNMRPIMKKYDINGGTSKMKKVELVDYITTQIKCHIRKGNYEISSDFGITKDMLYKWIVFTKFRKNVIIKCGERKFLKSRMLNMKREVIKAMLNAIQIRKNREMIEEKCDELEILKRFNISDIVDKEIKQWGNDITFELSPNIDKLEEHNQIYNIVKQFGGFNECHEKILYHGCDEKTKDSILNDGNFSLLMCGKKHGSRYGPGIYLTDKLWKAVQYSETTKKLKHYKYILICKVLVKNIKPALSYEVTFSGKTKNNEKEESYDTGVDNLDDPIEYIKKDSNQICVIGFMKICIERRYCKLLNYVYGNNNTGSLVTAMVSLKFKNYYHGDSISIYWMNPNGSKTTMNKRLLYGDATSIRTCAGHIFKCYDNVNSKLILIKTINQIDISNKYIIIA